MVAMVVKSDPMTRAIRTLIVLFLIFGAMPYLPEALNDIINNKISYAKFTLNEPLFHLNVKYVKDGIMILLLVLFFIQDVRRGQRYSLFLTYYPLLLLIAYGVAVSAFMNGAVNIYLVIAGLRSILLFLFCVKSLRYIKDAAFVRQLGTILAWLISIELVILLQQYNLFTKRFGGVNPFSLRLIGTFGGISIAGYFALGTSIYFYVARDYLQPRLRRLVPLLQLICLFVAGLSGTRSALIGCILILFFMLLKAAAGSEGSRKRGSLIAAAVFSSFLVLAVGTQLATVLADRGDIVEAQVEGGRIDMVTGFFKDNTFAGILFGDGIGYGTNSGVNLNKQLEVELDNVIMDGTINSILTQYGLFALVIVLILFGFCLMESFRKAQAGRKLDLFVLLLVNLVFCISTNIFEQFVYLFLLSAAIGSMSVLEAGTLRQVHDEKAAKNKAERNTERNTAGSKNQNKIQSETDLIANPAI